MNPYDIGPWYDFKFILLMVIIYGVAILIIRAFHRAFFGQFLANNADNHLKIKIHGKWFKVERIDKDDAKSEK